jgi:hypothetical protein
MLGSSSQYEEEHVMGHMKKLVGLCVGLMMVIIGSIAVATPARAGDTKVIKSKESGTAVSANFDFDNPKLSSPAFYVNGAGKSNVGQYTHQGVDELAPDGKTCTVPGGANGAGTEFTLAGDVGVFRLNATGDLFFFKSTSETACQDFSTLPTPPFPFTETGAGVVTGGTGAFSGATGTFTFEVKGASLSLDATGLRSFGWFEGTSDTTITVPDSD